MTETESGIYQIRNLQNNKLYIGSASNLNHRKNQHFSDLKLNKHKNIHLQRAWNKQHQTGFEFEILEYCEKFLLLEREQQYIDKYLSSNLLYNIALIAGNTLGRKLREETKQKLSKINMGENNPRTKLTWEDIKEIRKTYFEGSTQTDLAKKYGMSDHGIQHIIDNRNWYDPDYAPPANFFGRSGERNGGAKLTKEQVKDIREEYKNGGVYQKDLAKKYGVNKMTILRIINDKTWKEGKNEMSSTRLPS